MFNSNVKEIVEKTAVARGHLKQHKIRIHDGYTWEILGS